MAVIHSNGVVAARPPENKPAQLLRYGVGVGGRKLPDIVYTQQEKQIAGDKFTNYHFQFLQTIPTGGGQINFDFSKVLPPNLKIIGFTAVQNGDATMHFNTMTYNAQDVLNLVLTDTFKDSVTATADTFRITGYVNQVGFATHIIYDVNVWGFFTG